MKKVRFFPGVDVAMAGNFDCCMVSVNRLRGRKSDFRVNDWIMDSGAFTEISTHGHYRFGVLHYVKQICRWARCGNLLAAVSQDFMCEPFILEKTGLTVAEHQRLTIDRYDQLAWIVNRTYIMPVLQGFKPDEYAQHVRDYGDRLKPGAWVGVGSICKRNKSPSAIGAVLRAIHQVRPDLRLHGFGIKKTALACAFVQDHLYSADSMAWSFAARILGRDQNDWREAAYYARRIDCQSVQNYLEGFW